MPVIFDADGHLKIIDRAKDVGKLANGALFAPNYVENKLKFFSHIKEAVAFGHGRDMVCAFINIDMSAVGNWAERRGIPYSGYTDLAGRAEVYDLVQECVEKVNAELARDPVLCHSQVRRFLVLHKELDPDDDELTRTRKVRRGFIAEKYAVLIDALYSGRKSPVHRDAGEVRGWPHRLDQRRPRHPRRRGLRTRGRRPPEARVGGTGDILDTANERERTDHGRANDGRPGHPARRHRGDGGGLLRA